MVRILIPCLETLAFSWLGRGRNELFGSFLFSVFRPHALLDPNLLRSRDFSDPKCVLVLTYPHWAHIRDPFTGIST